MLVQQVSGEGTDEPVPLVRSEELCCAGDRTSWAPTATTIVAAHARIVILHVRADLDRLDVQIARAKKMKAAFTRPCRVGELLIMAADPDAAREFFSRLLDGVPEFKAVYDENFGYYEEVLPTMFLADLTRLVVRHAKGALADPTKSSDADSVCQRTAVFLDQALETDDSDLRDWIYGGFLSGLTQADEEAVKRIVDFFGPNLKHAWTTHFQE